MLRSMISGSGMTLLLDTHTFLWFCQKLPVVEYDAKTLLEDASHRKAGYLAILP